MHITSVSVVVPIFNVELYVEDCIRSVMRQTYDGPMECIVVDDCGIDSSMDIVEKLVVEYDGPISFKILHHTHNRGLSAARNTGMNAATGDYLFFLDSDDELTDDCFEKLTEPLNNEWYDFVVGNVSCVKILSNNQKMEIKTSLTLKIADKTVVTDSMILRTYRTGWNQTAWNKLYRADFIRQNRLFFKEGLIHEDNLWTFQIACIASSLFVINHVTYIYKVKREGSITYQFYRRNRVEALRIIIKEMSSFVDKNHINRIDVFPFFNNFFTYILNYYSFSISEFVSKYKELRPFIKYLVSCDIHYNHLHIKKYIRHIHYIMPTYIAPYWQFYIYYRLHPFIHKIRKR